MTYWNCLITEKHLRFVSGYLEDGGLITEGLIREIHKRLVDGVRGGAADPGEYRKVQNYVVNSATGETVYTPPPAHDVPDHDGGFVGLAQPRKRNSSGAGKRGCSVSACSSPPVSGRQRSRTSRLLSTLCLYRAGYDFKRAVHHQRVLRTGIDPPSTEPSRTFARVKWT